MHPVFVQAIAAERAREIQAGALAAQHARQLRGSRQGRRMWRLMGTSRTVTGPARLPATRPLRNPKAA
jgi:hypothetical protein